MLYLSCFAQLLTTISAKPEKTGSWHFGSLFYVVRGIFDHKINFPAFHRFLTYDNVVFYAMILEKSPTLSFCKSDMFDIKTQLGSESDNLECLEHF